MNADECLVIGGSCRHYREDRKSVLSLMQTLRVCRVTDHFGHFASSGLPEFRGSRYWLIRKSCHRTSDTRQR